jgi:putative transposase
LSTKQRGWLVRAVAARTHPGPFGTPVQVSRASLDRWIRGYRTGGFAVLVPAPRRLAPHTPDDAHLNRVRLFWSDGRSLIQSCG